MSLSKIQTRYYRSILDFIEKHKYAPSYDEIATMVGVRSLATVKMAVERLIEKGFLARDPNAGHNMRNLMVVPQKMHNMNSCNRNHEPVWFFRDNCVVCELLKRIQDLRA
jgi:SOS-response transcriptional repressor LexA